MVKVKKLRLSPPVFQKYTNDIDREAELETEFAVLFTGYLGIISASTCPCHERACRTLAMPSYIKHTRKSPCKTHERCLSTTRRVPVAETWRLTVACFGLHHLWCEVAVQSSLNLVSRDRVSVPRASSASQIPYRLSWPAILHANPFSRWI